MERYPGQKQIAQVALAYAFLILVFGSGGAALAVENGDPAAAPVHETHSPQLDLHSPRETMKVFLNSMRAVEEDEPGAMDTALATLNLKAINTLVRREKGEESAWTLFEILKKDGKVNLKRIPGKAGDGHFVYKKFGDAEISMSEQSDGQWLFSATTIRNLPEILQNLSAGLSSTVEPGGHTRRPWYFALREQLPAGLRQKRVWLEHWQWLGILVCLITGWLADWLVRLLLRSSVRLWRRRSKMAELWLLPDDWLSPLGLMAMAGIWWSGVNALGFSADTLVILLVAVKLLAGFSGIWSGCRLVDFVCAYLQHNARRTQNKLDDVLVPLVRKTLKLVVSVIGILFVASNLNLNVTGLLAGLGLGGLAFALAGKDMVQNLFGSVTVLLDQSFHVGDWVIIGDVEGTVEEVGLRSTRIRTFYNSEVILPNSRLITASIDNMGKRRYRRLSCKVSVVYGTPPQRIEMFCEAVRELVRLHPFMRTDYFQVYLNELAASSLEILVYVFWETPDWSTELQARHRFLLDLLKVADELGVEFAFPTQTVFLPAPDPGEIKPTAALDENANLEKARQAARSIAGENTGGNHSNE